MKRLLAGVAMLAAMATAAGAVDTPPSTDLPDLSAIRAQIYSGEYDAALVELTALCDSVKHADVYNLLGYTTRQLGQYDASGRWYREALFYDPTHRPALEYQGELFLKLGDLDAAQGNLAMLDLFCPEGCAERDTLAAAIATWQQAPVRPAAFPASFRAGSGR